MHVQYTLTVLIILFQTLFCQKKWNMSQMWEVQNETKQLVRIALWYIAQMCLNTWNIVSKD